MGFAIAAGVAFVGAVLALVFRGQIRAALIAEQAASLGIIEVLSFVPLGFAIIVTFAFVGLLCNNSTHWVHVPTGHAMRQWTTRSPGDAGVAHHWHQWLQREPANSLARLAGGEKGDIVVHAYLDAPALVAFITVSSKAKGTDLGLPLITVQGEGYVPVRQVVAPRD